jgi:pimeloyl-ACP methyl ester carboxylesterase
VWGDRDPIIPHSHGLQAHELMPGSRLEIFEGSGHFPHQDDPSRFAGVMRRFVEETKAARLDAGILRDKLLGRERRAA